MPRSNRAVAAYVVAYLVGMAGMGLMWLHATWQQWVGAAVVVVAVGILKLVAVLADPDNKAVGGGRVPRRPVSDDEGRARIVLLGAVIAFNVAVLIYRSIW